MNWCKFRQAVAYTPKLVVISSTYQLYNLSWRLFSMYGSLNSLSGNLTFLILNWMWGCFVASPIQSFTVRPAPICRIDGLVWSNGCSEVNAILVFFRLVTWGMSNHVFSGRREDDVERVKCSDLTRSLVRT